MKTLHKIKTTAALAVLLFCALIPSTPARGQPWAVIQDRPDGPAYLAASVLVQFKTQATDAELADAVGRGQFQVIEHIQTEAMKAAGHLGVSHLATALPVWQAVRALRNHPAVEFAEPNWVYTHQAVSNDPYFTGGQLWGMYGDLSSPANPYGSQAAEAWAAGYTGSSSVVVGVIDEGMQVGHADLKENIWVNPSETVDGFDDDGNTYVDDINGWDFYNNDNSVYDGTADDHGTHVTGTIAALGGNGIGVAGVNWSAKLISGKFLGPTGGTTDAAIKAVDYFTALKKRGINIVALNNSWGGGAYSQFLHDAIIRAAKANILFIAAAGNGDRRGRAINLDATPYYPACYDTSQGTATENAASYDSVIAVTAIDNIGNKASWANYGATKVDLGAPGVNIYSTLPDNTYGAYDGTSMATPHVTGAVALYASTHPAASALEIKAAILAATTPTASLAGKTVTGGRLDLSTVITPTTPPEPGDEPPTVSIASPQNNAIVAKMVEITALATDDDEVTEVKFFVDETSIGTGSYNSDGWSVSWDTSQVGDGWHTLTAVATDSIGQTTPSTDVSVLVNNEDDPCAIIVPSGYEDAPANNWSGTLTQPLRIQQVYTPQGMGIAEGVTLYGMAFRLDSSVVSAVNGSIKILVRLSTTAAQPDKLNTRFSSNVGADVKQVFSDTVELKEVVAGGFDVVIPFGATSFAYNPGAGNLLVDIATYTGVADAKVDAAYVGLDGTSRIFALNPSATKAAYYDTQGDVIRFQLCPPPQ